MTFRRELQRQQTRKAMLEALERLMNNQSLRVAPPYKINVLTVEKEAGFSIGSMRNYPDIKELVVREKNKTQLEKAPTPSESKNFRTKTKNLNQKLDREKRLKNDYKCKLEAAEDALAKAHTTQAELVMTLHDLLSHDQRLKLYSPKVIEFENKNKNK